MTRRRTRRLRRQRRTLRQKPTRKTTLRMEMPRPTRRRQLLRGPRRRPSQSSTTARAFSFTACRPESPSQSASQPPTTLQVSHGFPPRRIVNRGIFLSMIL